MARSSRSQALTLTWAEALDDEAIRKLLRDNSMEGQIRLTLARDPDARLAAAIEGDRHCAVLVRDADGRLLGMGSRCVRQQWLAGQSRKIGYLGQFRKARGTVMRPRALARAFSMLLARRQSDEAEFDLTSIASDNHSARRLLERGIPGLPSYVPLFEQATLVLHTRARRWRDRSDTPLQRCRPSDLDEVVQLSAEHGHRHDFAPHWTRDDLESRQRCRNLEHGDFYIWRRRGTAVACAAIWDQRAFKQIEVAGYAAQLARWRHCANLGLRILGQPTLPPPGTTLAHAFLSHFAWREGHEAELPLFVRALSQQAARRHIDYLSLGLDRQSPVFDAIRHRNPCRVHSSQIYRVWPETPPAQSRAPQNPHLEIAIA